MPDAIAQVQRDEGKVDMTPKTVAVLGLCAVVSVAAASYGVSQRVGFETTEFEGQRVFPELVEQAPMVTEMIVTQSGEIKTFQLIDEQWTLAESDNYPVHNNAVTKVMFGLSNMQYLDAKTASPERHRALQLEEPKTKQDNSQLVALKTSDGNVIAELLVGRANYFLPETTTGGMYVRKPGENQTWLVRGLVDIGAEPRDWLQRTIVDIPVDNVRRAEARHPDGELQLVRPNPDVTGGFEFENLPEGTKLKSEFAPRNIAALLNSFVLNNVRKAENVALDPQGAYVGVFDTVDDQRITLNMWQQDGTQYLVVGAAYTGNDPDSDAAKQVADITARTTGWVYIVPEYQFEQLSKKFDVVTEPADNPS